MLLLSNAFVSVSLILFFYSVIFAADSFSPKQAAPLTPRNETTSFRSLITLVAIDTFAVYSIVTGQTTSSIDVNPTVIMAAAGVGNALYALTGGAHTPHYIDG